jgi:hypothetical protein
MSMTDIFRDLCAELLADYDNCHYRSELSARARTALNQPEPVAPTDEEILKLAAKELCYTFNESWFLTGRNCPDLDTDPCELLDFARAVLARYGTPAIQPAPVISLLPGPEDCDEEGRCWWGEPQIGNSHDATWTLCTQKDAEEWCTWGTKGGWLPANALPTPEDTND